MPDQVLAQTAAGAATNEHPAVSAQTNIDYTSALVAIPESLIQRGAAFPSNLNPSIDPTPQLSTVNAIMDESSLPEPPEALIENVLGRGGKMLISGASKSYKSFLAIWECIAVATGTQWLGIPCKQGRVLYANLEIGYARFMDRVFRMADALGIDKAMVAKNFTIVENANDFDNMRQLVDSIIQSENAQEYTLVVIDPLYKIYNGSENEQQDMTAFFAEVDRLISQLGCATTVIHHHSKGFQGYKDVADRACGSSVLSRDPDTIVTVGRTCGEGNTLRAEFIFRDYPDMAPIDFWFEYPMFRIDDVGILANRKYTTARGANSTSEKQHIDRLSEIEAACEELMAGRTCFNRLELVAKLGMSKKRGSAINDALMKSSRFRCESNPNSCMIYRKERPTPPPLRK